MLVVGAVLGLAAFLVLTLVRCFFRVDEGHVAVLTTFGAAEHVAGDPKRLRTYPPGLHRKRPWQKVLRVPVMEQNLDLSGEAGGRTAMAEDGTVLRIDSILRYAPVEQDLAAWLFQMRSPLEHVTALFTCLLRNEIACFRVGTGPDRAASEDGSYAAIRRDRKNLNARIEELCRARIGARTGVRFGAVDLTEIVPPDELADALNAVMNARNEADALFHRSEADCAQRVVAAERGVAIAKARAAAAATEVETLARFLEDLDERGTLDAYVRRRRDEVLSQSRSLFLRSSQ